MIKKESGKTPISKMCNFNYNINFYLSYNNICVKSEKSSVDKPQDRFCIFPQKRDTDFSVSPFYPIPNELAQ